VGDAGVVEDADVEDAVGTLLLSDDASVIFICFSIVY